MSKRFLIYFLGFVLCMALVAMATRQSQHMFWVELNINEMAPWFALKEITTTNGPVEIGFRKNGLVVWRKTPQLGD